MVLINRNANLRRWRRHRARATGRYQSRSAVLSALSQNRLCLAAVKTPQNSPRQSASDCSRIGTGGSNPLRSATESHLCGFTSRISEIARACGLFCMPRGTGERNFRRFKGKMRPKSLLASEAVPSMPNAGQDQFADVAPRGWCGSDRRKRTRRFPRLVFARSKGKADRSVRPRPRR